MQTSKIFGAIMLVSCTTIGGGILALPVRTFNAGLIPTCTNFIISWIFMTMAALYMLEVSINAKPHANIISMAYDLLGIAGKIFAWIAYLALLYALMCAFITSISAWVSNFTTLSTLPINILISLIFGGVIYAGHHYLDSVNKIFSITLFISLFYIIILALMHIDFNMLEHHSIRHSILTTPLILTSFGFAIVIPSINNYLNFDVKKIKYVILIGSFIPLIIYVLWELALLGALDRELINFRQQVAINGTEVASALSHAIGSTTITLSAEVFSLTAIITSILGVGLSLFDFLADGLQIKKNPLGKVLLCSIIFIPTFLLIDFFPLGFDTILSFGGIFVACLLGILPTILVWQQRRKNIRASYQAPGGKVFMLMTIIFFTSVIIIEIYNCLN
jgi:tyrosine-specific transport protein